MAEPRPPPNAGYLARAHRALTIFGLFYVVAIFLLGIPWVQRHAIYTHALNFPFGAKFDQPHLYYLAPNRAANVNLTTSDGLRLGAWFVLSEDVYTPTPVPTPGGPTEENLKHAITTRPTIIFFHGRAANRAAVFRPKVYGQYTTRLRVNMLAIDYRGFGDSEGQPSESGLVEDARAAWDWLTARGAHSNDIILMGESLGTGVVAGFAAQLAVDNVSPRGVVLVAGFRSFPLMLEHYQAFGWLPILGPLRSFPFATKFLFKFLNTHFDTQASLPTVKAPIILIHAHDDTDIPATQSDGLFQALLEEHLTPVPTRLQKPMGAVNLKVSERDELNKLHMLRRTERQTLVTKTDLLFGDLEYFDGEHGRVSLVHPHTGGHNKVLLSEGVVDYVGMVFGLRHEKRS